MSLLTSLSNFLVYLRLHKGRSRKTQEQYTFHIWRFICYMIPELEKIQSPLSDDSSKIMLHINDFLPPIDKEAMKNWKSPLPALAKQFSEPTIQQITKDDFDSWRLSLADSGLSVKTVNAHIITIRSWLKYLKKEQIDSLDPTTLDLMRVIDREVTFLTSEEIERFFYAIDTKTIQ
jgi:integrase